MKYKQGSFGRVFVLRFDDKDDLLNEIKSVAIKEILGIDAVKTLDEKTGLVMLEL